MTSNSIVAPRTYYVYTYAFPDPDGIVFYVGKGTEGRMFVHEQEAQGGCSCKKCHIIRQIWDSGKPVQKRIVYETLIEQDALIYEWVLINLIHNSPNLTNIRDNLQIKKIPHVKVGTIVNYSRLPLTYEVDGEIYYSTAETCKRFNIAARTVKRWAQHGWVRKYVSAKPTGVYYALVDLEKVTSMMLEEDWQRIRPKAHH